MDAGTPWLWIPAGILLAVLAVILLLRLVRLAAGLVAAAVLLSLLFTLFRGDGGGAIRTIGTLLPDLLAEAWSSYRQAEERDPVLDAGRAGETAARVFSTLRGEAEKGAEDTPSGFRPDASPG